MKPTLFLDMDRTLFDADALIRFWNTDYSSRRVSMIATLRKEIPGPDWESLVYPDVRAFLRDAHERFQLVVVSFTTLQEFQEYKVSQSGVGAMVDEVLYTTEDGKKGEVIAEYIRAHGLREEECVFIDDVKKNLDSVAEANTAITCLLIDRTQGVESVSSIEQPSKYQTLRTLDDARRVLGLPQSI